MQATNEKMTQKWNENLIKNIKYRSHETFTSEIAV